MHNQLPCAFSQGMQTLLDRFVALLAVICAAACQKLAWAALGVGRPAALASFTASLNQASNKQAKDCIAASSFIAVDAPLQPTRAFKLLPLRAIGMVLQADIWAPVLQALKC